MLRPVPVAGVIAVLLAVLVAAGCGDEDGGGGAEADGGGGKLQKALKSVDPTEFGAVAASLKVKQIERLPRILHVTLKTPEGGFEGPSVDDLDGSAAGAFKAIYADTGWRRAATVTFEGGLVDTRTGKDLPNEETGIYRLEAKKARQIDWDNAAVVDWSLYRVFASSALKGD